MRLHPHYTDDLPGTGGHLKRAPEDFIVEEIPAYPPSGSGTHLFLTIEKRGISTQEMVRRVARALAIPPTAIGVAGQKDQQAVARQVISVPAEDPVKAANLKLDGLTVLSAARHQHKLRTGHLRGNRFIITVHGVVPDAEARARAVLARLADGWLPNFFGAQRFGRGAENIADGRALLRGERRVPDRFRRRFLLSALQAGLFNRYLAARMADGLLHRVISGEVLQRTQTGGLFTCADAEMVAAQVRLERREIVPAGPMFGHKIFGCAPGSVAAAREQAILDAEGVRLDDFAPFAKLAEGTRRALLVRIEDPSVRQEGDRMIVAFALPSGSYATVLLDEIMKADPSPAPAAAPTDEPPNEPSNEGDDGGEPEAAEPS